jgi:hypothetical protein
MRVSVDALPRLRQGGLAGSNPALSSAGNLYIEGHFNPALDANCPTLPDNCGKSISDLSRQLFEVIRPTL